MAKGGKNVKFLRTGLTLNGRVYMRGEIDSIETAFKNDAKMLSTETQIEVYGQVFYETTDEPMTDPNRFMSREEERVHIGPSPQMAEIGAPRNDGMGESTVSSPGRPTLISASTTRYPVPKDLAVTSEMPLLPPSKKELQEELAKEGAQPQQRLIFRFGNKGDEKNQGGRKKKLVTAKATQLQA